MNRQTGRVDDAYQFIVEIGNASAIGWCTKVLLEAIENDEKAHAERLTPCCEAVGQLRRRFSHLRGIAAQCIADL